jgi:alpha-beta hydrolase superfamily lysophospholipase
VIGGQWIREGRGLGLLPFVFSENGACVELLLGWNAELLACVWGAMGFKRAAAIVGVATASVWLGLCLLVGVVAAESALHPIRNVLTPDAGAAANAIAMQQDARMNAVEVRAGDGVKLEAWEMKPRRWNGDAVLLLHGLSDNRAGMLGPANMLLAHGYAVLLADARAHGASGGTLATYGAMERNDVRAWFEWMQRSEHPRCTDAIGDSMGAGELLESLSVEGGFCAVVAESPFANFREAAYDRMGQQIGAGPWVGRTLLRPAVEFGLFYARMRYGVNLEAARPDEAVAASGVPVLLIHGLMDDNLPPRHSQMIVTRNGGRNPHVVLWEPPDAEHCGASSAEPAEYERRVVGWFKR